jgi:voltage-gated potassium channel Kch
MIVDLTLIGLGMAILTVIMHALGTGLWVKVLKRYQSWLKIQQGLPALGLLLATAVFLLTLNTLEAIAWATVYWLSPSVAEIYSFERALYFSFITFTTLGYGDITISSDWQLLCGLEAMNGIFLFGWSAALLYAVVQRTWGDRDPEHREVKADKQN